MKYASSLEDVEVIPTGTFIDKIAGGLPRGRIVEIFGDESVGKSTLCLQVVARGQRDGLKCLWVDVEHSFEPRYATALGVDNSKLGIIREPLAEETLNRTLEEVENGKWDIIVLDSIGALRSRTDAEKSFDEKTIGVQASLVSKLSRSLAPLVPYKKTCFIGINHSFIDLMSGVLMTSGGKKWRYHKAFSLHLKVNSKVVIKSGENKVGKVVIAEVKKDKLFGKEGVKVDGQLLFGTGFSIEADQFADELASGKITKQGNTFLRDGVKLGVGKLRAQEALKSLV